jgi:hypothetical protein
MSNTNKIKHCCEKFDEELNDGLLEHNTNPDHGKVGYFFEMDCMGTDYYYKTDIIKYCPFCGMPTDVMLIKRKLSVIK